MNAESFLRVILARESEDAPRLVFADWLDDQRQHDHAQFIRVQCELARHASEDERWLELKLQEEELWQRLSPRWEEVLRRTVFALVPLDVPTPRFCLEWFRRGFIEHYPWHGPHEGLVEFSERCTFVLAITSLELTSHPTLDFFGSPHMWRVEHLGCERSGITDAHMQPFATSAHFGRLKGLELYRNYVGPDGIAALAHCPSMRSLKSLGLTENRLGDAGTCLLAVSPICKTLTHLELIENGIGDEGVFALAESPYLTALAELHLSNNNFSVAAIEALEASSYLTSLRKLSVGTRGDDDFDNPVFRRWTQRLDGGFDNEVYDEA